MRVNVAIAREKANQDEHAAFTRVNTRGTIILAINQALRKKFGSKTWASIAFLLKLEERTAKHRLAGTRPYDFDDATKLLRSEVGFEVLTAMMGDKKYWPAWFVACVLAVREAKLMTDFTQHQLEIEEFKKLRAPEMAKLAEEA